jgi:hypothetical protein
MSIYTSIKFNGYCSEADNLAMTLHFLDSIKGFANFTYSLKQTKIN